MTKYELNKRLAELVKPYGPESIPPDYCSNWNQLMPLAIEHGVMPHESDWDESMNCTKYLAHDRNLNCEEDKDPAIAIVKCLIAKLESER